MNLHVLGSSSAGNGYILENGSEALIIECGIKLHEVKKVLNYRIGIITGAVCSHVHGDHSGKVAEYLKAGIHTLAGADVFEKHGYGPYARIIKTGKGFRFGRFSVVPFPLEHDVPCFGFLIEHPETGKIVFLTDTYYCTYTFRDVNHWIIEANYADDIIEKKILEGKTHRAMLPRLRSSHMELETTKDIMRANDMRLTHNIVLCHLSDSHSDETRFISEIQALTGNQVFAAKKGLTVNFSIDPF